jgi:hypothetical protein
MIQTNLKFREVIKDHDLVRFSEFTAKYIDVCYPIEYLRRSKVIAMVTENHLGEIEQMFGGYIMALEGPFRSIQQLPIEVCELRLELQKMIDKSMELTGLWVHPMLSGGRARFRLWWKIFMDMIKLTMNGTSHFVYSYDASQPKLGKMYSIGKPQRIYEGPVFIEGMKEANTEIVEVGSILALVLGFISRPLCMAKFICKRLFRRKNILGRARTSSVQYS